MPTIYKLPYDSHIRYLPLVYIMPDILAFYEIEEGQREFAEWKKQREAEKQEAKTE